jgi:hypothetical protein
MLILNLAKQLKKISIIIASSRTSTSDYTVQKHDAPTQGHYCHFLSTVLLKNKYRVGEL